MEVVLILIVLLFFHINFKPYIDKTSSGDIVIWFNWKNKRIYKYLWKKQ